MANCELYIQLSYIPGEFNVESHDNNENINGRYNIYTYIIFFIKKIVNHNLSHFLDTRHIHPETSNKKGGATGAITGATKIFNDLGGSKVSSLLKKKDKDEKKKDKEEEMIPKEEPIKEVLPKEEPKAGDIISKKKSKVEPEEPEPINAKQDVKEEPISYKPQEQLTENDVETEPIDSK